MTHTILGMCPLRRRLPGGLLLLDGLQSKLAGISVMKCPHSNRGNHCPLTGMRKVSAQATHLAGEPLAWENATDKEHRRQER